MKKSNKYEKGLKIAKKLGNMPPNECDPDYLHYYVYSKLDAIRVSPLTFNMPGLNAVSSGSEHPYYLMKIDKSKGQENPIVIIGKGITFDSGGISIKPSRRMHEMKYDMSGAGNIIGAIHNLGRQNEPFIALLPIAENMPGTGAYRPGDVIRYPGNKSVEVLDTDAEGRMILADAINYAVHHLNPSLIITVATLTGSMVAALGHKMFGIFGSDNVFPILVHEISESVGEPSLVMPMFEEDSLKEMKSRVADLANIGKGNVPGHSLAASFLKQFTKGVPFVHLDIAGVAWNDKGSTGIPVKTLTEIMRKGL